MPDEVFSLGRPVELAVVIPAYNERENVAPLLVALETALVGIEWEVIFVDDNSPDGTADTIRTIAIADRRVRVLERIGRRGLSSACIEGMLSTPAPYHRSSRRGLTAR
jgi:dolichol-phosphate mannosyltransferase